MNNHYSFKHTPPHDIQAEQAVLGAIFLDNSVLDSVLSLLKPSDFYNSTNRILYSCMCALNNENSKIDVVTLSNMLKERHINQKNIFIYVSNLANSVPTTSNVKYYAKIVQHKSLGRKLLIVAHQLTELGYKKNGHPSAMLDDAESKLLSVAQLNSSDGLQPIDKLTQQTFNHLDQLQKNHSNVTGEPTGYKYVDNLTTGLHPGQFMIIAARPAMGKTTLALNIAQNVAKLTHKTVAIFSLEMKSTDLVNHLLCADSNVDAMHVREGNLTQAEGNRLVIAAGQLARQKIYIDDTAGINIGSILARSRRLDKQSKGNLGLIVVDYLQLVEGNHNDNRQLEVSEISRQLKKLSLELNVPVIALSQLSRSVEQRDNKRPQLSDIRESGSIEQDADIVSFLYRKDYYENQKKRKQSNNSKKVQQVSQTAQGDPSITEFLIEKNRDGPRGMVKLMFFKAYNKFNTIDTSQLDNHK